MSRHLLALLSTAGFLAACADTPDDPTIDPPPAPTVETVEVVGVGPDLQPGDTVQLVARAFDAQGQEVAGRTFAWESDNTAVATVNGDGLVTAVASGEATIYATTDFVTGGAFLTVAAIERPPVSWVDVHPSGEVHLSIGETLQVDVVVHAEDGQVLEGRVVTWASSDSAVATVSTSGLVTAVGPGDAWISADCEGSLDEMLVRVSDVVDPPAPVDHVTLDYTELALPVGETLQLVAQPRDATGAPLDRPVTWSSDNPSYVSVDANGLVTALDVGGADITATSEGRSTSVRVYATHVTSYTLVGLGGSALPALLGSFTQTNPDGSSSTRSVRIYDGYLAIDHGSQTYDAVVQGIYVLPVFWVPVPITYESNGVVTIDAATGEHTFTPQLGRAFTAQRTATGLEVHWQLDDRIAGESVFAFHRD